MKLSSPTSPDTIEAGGFPGRGGLTLLELLVAVVITVIVGVSVVTSLYSGRTAWQAGDAIVQRHQNARAALDMVARDLQQAYSGSDLTNFLFAGSLYVFTALTGNPAEGFDVKWIEYRMTGGVLERAEYDYELGFPFDWDAPDAGENSAALAWNISGMEFLFYHIDGAGNEVMETEWDYESEGKLPRSVEIRITAGDGRPGGREEAFSTEVHLPLHGLRFVLP